MDKLFTIICELVEKLDSLIIQQPGGNGKVEVESDIFPVEITGEIPQKFTGNNQSRLEVWLHNDSDSDLFLAMTPISGDVSRDRFSVRVAPGDTYIMNAQQAPYVYKRSVYGFWEAGAALSSRVMVTEFTAVPV